VGKIDGDGAVLWLSYFGNNASDLVRDCDIDAQGFVYIGHHSAAGADPDLGTPGAYRSASYAGSGHDVVIAKLTPDGRSVVWATYLGGTADDDAPSIRVHGDGSVYVATDTTSANFPLVNPVQSVRGSARDYALARIAPDGASLLFSTLLGGNGNIEFVGTHNLGIDVDGNAYLCAETDSTDFPGTNGFFQPFNAGGVDHIFAKVKVTAPTEILAATYVGASGRDGEVSGCAVDDDGNLLAAGGSEGSGTSYPTTIGAYQTDTRGGRDAVVVQVAADFLSLRYASYLGGDGEDAGRAAVVRGNTLIAAGVTASSDYPTRNAYQANASENPVVATDGLVSVISLPLASPTPTRTVTWTRTATRTHTRTASATRTATRSRTPTATPSLLPTATRTAPPPSSTPTTTVAIPSSATPSPVPGDLTGDERVTDDDLTLLVHALFAPTPPAEADVNRDGHVSGADVSELLNLLADVLDLLLGE
jgi:hypothetical protein